MLSSLTLVVRTEQGNGVGCVLQSHADGSANVQWMNSTDLQSNPRRTWSFSWESPGANKFGERVGPDHRNEMACWDRVSRENMVKKFRWPAMEKDETVARRLPKEARDYFGGD